MTTRQVARHCLRGGFDPWWLVTRDKRPVTPRWGSRPATADRIADLQAGEEAGLVPGSIQHRVVDVDRKDGEKQEISEQDLRPLYEALGPPSWSMRSLSGNGWHLWYRTSRRISKANNVEYGGLTMDVIDTKGYVVMLDPVPVFEKDLAALPVVDDWTALVQRPVRQPATQSRSGTPTVGVFSAGPAGRNETRIEAAIEAVRCAAEGTRNVTVNREAFVVGLVGGTEQDLQELIAVSFLTFRSVEGETVARRAYAAGRAARRTA